mmetsp:Transcript_18095/g.25449  ORF Transcript_18095/g.25449 Transcript_18095/m.25449 type:complete len:83 (+) Transcript_18095:675-923(+)
MAKQLATQVDCQVQILGGSQFLRLHRQPKPGSCDAEATLLANPVDCLALVQRLLKKGSAPFVETGMRHGARFCQVRLQKESS